MNLKSLVPLVLFGLSFLPAAHAQTSIDLIDLAGLSPYTHYRTFETEHFTFIYPDGYAAFAKLAAKHIEHAHTILSPILQWTPRSKTTVLVTDNTDSANGLTMPALRVGIILNATPPDAWMSTSYSDDWIKLLVFHEYTHLLNIDATTEWMNLVRILFGDVIRPNGLWPVWMLEGLAVYYETRTSTMGRGRSPEYDSILRAFYVDGKLGNRSDFGVTLDRVNGDFPFFPGGEVPYLFGYHLWNEFAKDQSDAKMGDYSIRSSHRIPYFIEGNLENVTGKNWIDYWDSFLAASKTRFDGQIQKIREEGETKPEFVSQAGYEAQGGTISADGKWMAYTRVSKDSQEGLWLRDLSDGDEHRIQDKNSGVGMAFSPDSRYLVFSTIERYDTYSTFSDLELYDLKKNRVQTLAHGLRAKDPSFSPDGKQITFIQDAKASNWLKCADIAIDNDGNAALSNFHDAYTPPEFSILGNPHFIDDHQIVFSMQTLGHAQSDLILADSHQGGSRVLVADGNMNREPYPTAEGILYISNLDGIENVYRISADGKFKTKLSNLITGASLPFSGPDGTLYASVMTSEGYEIAKLASGLKSVSPSTPNPPSFHPGQVVAHPDAPTPLADALQSPELKFDPSPRDYSPWKSMLPREWAPITYATYGSLEGFSMWGSLLGFDSTGKQQYLAWAGYHFKPKTFDFNLDYTIYAFRPMIDLSVSAITNDIGIGPHDSEFTRTYEAFASLGFPIRWTYSSLLPQIYGFVDWRGAYDLDSGNRVASNDFELAKPLIPGFGAQIGYSRVERSPLGFMTEEGTELSLASEARNNPDEFTLYKYMARASQYIPIGSHSVLNPVVRWLGSSRITGTERGYSLLESRDPNNVFDRGTGSSLKRLEFRGYTHTFLTRSSGVASVDFHFPVTWIFSGLHHTLPVFFNQAHGFVFAETGYVPSTRFGNLFLPSYGLGLNLDTTLLVRAPITFSFEMQNGTRKDFGGDQTFFFSMSASALPF